MASNGKFNASIDVEELAAELDGLEQLADRVVLSGHGLAAPLLRAQAAQRRREVVRTVKRKGADHPDVARRRANVERADARLGLVAEELDRARVDRPAPAADGEATVWGRVVDGGAPVGDVTVSVISDGKRHDYRCTDEVGAFAISMPADTPFELSVRDKEGTELYRDDEAATLTEGQQQRREIDLAGGDHRPCPAPPDEPDDERPDPTTFVMPDLVGKSERAATTAIKKLELELAGRTEEDVMGPGGRIVSHDPAAGLDVAAGDPIDIVVGVDARTDMPDVVGMRLDEAESILKEAGLDVGDVQRTPTGKKLVERVVRQDPVGGEPVAPGTAVVLFVGEPTKDEADVEPFIRVVSTAEDRLRELDVFGSDEPSGILLRKLAAAGVDDVEGLEQLLGRDRETLRDVLDLRTLARTDRTIAALKRALSADG